MNLEDWVEKAENKTDAEFRKAINIVLKAIATNEKLSHSMAFKGGLLLGIKYENLRYTTDLDFSTPDTRPGDIENFKENLDLFLSLAESDLAYGLKCKVQKISKMPKLENAMFPALKIKIAYIANNSQRSSLIKYDQDMCPQVISIDYSFNEETGDVEQINIDSESKLICYTLESLVAEKFRSILQQVVRNRYRGQDIYDLNFLLENHSDVLEHSETKEKILDTLKIKSVGKDIDQWLTKLGMRDSDIKNRALKEYSSIDIQIPEALPNFEDSYIKVQNYFESLPW